MNKVTLVRKGKCANLVLAWPGLTRRRPRNAGTPWHRRRTQDSVRLYVALSTALHSIEGKISPGSMGIYVSVLLHISQVQAHANPRRRPPDEGGDRRRLGRTDLGRRPRRGSWAAAGDPRMVRPWAGADPAQAEFFLTKNAAVPIVRRFGRI